MKLQQLHVMEKSKQQRTLRWGGLGGWRGDRGRGRGKRKLESVASRKEVSGEGHILL